MDRRMFDMSEFYRMSDTASSEPIREKPARMQTEKSGECADPLTMVFINVQPLDSVYPVEEAYTAGTLFPNLNKPFLGGMRNER
ncbi:MAG: spore coat associated protein CotJA [Acutalibacteraceae bacterium]